MFNRMTLVRASLRHHWKTSLAIWLGVATATAVMTGAFLVGDSMRGSLRQMTLDRLGHVDAVLIGPRFVTEGMAVRLQHALDQEWKESGTAFRVSPALLLPGSLEARPRTVSSVPNDKPVTHRAGQVQVHGVPADFWKELSSSEVDLKDRHAAITGELAETLHVRLGDSLTLWIELPSAVPRETLLGRKDENSQEVTLTVQTILPGKSVATHFGLNPTQAQPRNLFVPLTTLQQALDLAATPASRRQPVSTPARVNALFVATPDHPLGQPAITTKDRDAVTRAVRSAVTLEDVQLRLVPDDIINALSVESERLLLEDPLATAAKAAAKDLGRSFSPVMVYLANSLKNPKSPDKHYSMYSTVAGLDLLDLPSGFGDFEFAGEQPTDWEPHDVILNDYVAKDLAVAVGDPIAMSWHRVGSKGELPEETGTFTVRGILKMGGAAADPHLTPVVKGITDTDSLANWDQPFPMNLDAVTPRDDEYWTRYKATPKAFLPLAAAQRLWPNRYGTLTSIRVAPGKNESLGTLAAAMGPAILRHLELEAAGLAVQPLKAQGLQAAGGATDFTGLFIGFSFFLILAAMILVLLLVRLGIRQRVTEWGLLGAIGFTPSDIRNLLLREGLLLAVGGAVPGMLCGILYARVMIYGLTTWWHGATQTTALFLSMTPLSLALGVLISVLCSLGAIAWGTRDLKRQSLRDQIAGLTEDIETPDSGTSARGPKRLAWAAITTAAALWLGVLSAIIPRSEAFSGLSWPIVSFFLTGICLLVAGLAGLSAWLRSRKGAAVHGAGLPAIARLSARNARRERRRSVLTVGMIASATFVIIAVASGQKDPTAERPSRDSGNGGFTLVGESTTPLLFNLNTSAGRKSLNWQERPSDAGLLSGMTVFPFRVHSGEDASCLNLFQSTAPTILGATPEFIAQHRFHFIGGGEKSGWSLLDQETSDGSIPVIGGMNTLLYSLKKGVGDTLPAPDAEAARGSKTPATLRIAGMLDGGVLQGVLVMSEANFLKLYPHEAGYRYFLVETSVHDAASTLEMLETQLAPFGLDLEPVADRIARFLSVQNTYLSTFQALGGLGLLLGTLGLAAVMLRNVLERQRELALLQAIGFTRGRLAILVLCENALLLLWGLGVGTIAALVAMLPQLGSAGAGASWLTGTLWLGLIFTTGMLAALAAVRTAVTTPILQGLRSGS